MIALQMVKRKKKKLMQTNGSEKFPHQQLLLSLFPITITTNLTLELENRRPTPSMQTCSRPPSPDWMSWTGNSPPSSMPGVTPPTPLAAALSMAALMQ